MLNHHVKGKPWAIKVANTNDNEQLKTQYKLAKIIYVVSAGDFLLHNMFSQEMRVITKSTSWNLLAI